MMRVELAVPDELTEKVLALLTDDHAVSQVSVIRGASLKPEGDVVMADIAREAANELIERLTELGVNEHGSMQVGEVPAWSSRAGLEALEKAPGSSADAVVWAQVNSRAYADAELNVSFVSFMTLACLIAAIGIVIDSQILTIGAMVLGPEFGAVAAVGVALVQGRWGLMRRAVRTLLIGFGIAMVTTFALSLLAGAVGWVEAGNLSRHPETAFIYSPDHWSLVIAMIAGAAGVLSLTSAKTGGLQGVFISVTTIPAAGNIALGAAFGEWGEVLGSAQQLGINLAGMAAAGYLTLVVHKQVWDRVGAKRLRLVRED